MGKNQILFKIAAALLVLTFIIYIGYQLLSSLSDRVETVDAMLVTVEDRIAVEGIFFRSQALVTGGEEKSMEYLVEDGEKVAKGQELAVYFSSSAAAGVHQQIQHLDESIASLEYVIKTLTGGADAAKMDGLIYVEMQNINKELGQGGAAKVTGHYASLAQLVVGRGATQSGSDQYKEQLEALRKERTSLENTLKGNASRVHAAESGYFFKRVDGLERVLTPAAVREMTPEQLETVRPQALPGDTLGALTNSYEWYLACILTREEAGLLRDRSRADFYFAQLGSQKLTMQLDWLKSFDNDRSIAVFKSGVMNEKYLSTRFQPTDIALASYTGIKIPREALRQVDGEWGVYCLEGAVARFKPVSWVYQTDSYVLAPSAANAKAGLYMYDKIIIRQKGLEDRKVVK